MFFDFKFWHFLTNPHLLANQLGNSSMRGFKKRVLFVAIFGVLLFAIRDIWGMNTESITELLSTMTTTDYTIARYVSVVGALIWALIYMAFHFFGFAYILSLLTAIPFKKLLPLQLLMTGILLIEKAIILLVFTVKGAATSMSFLSFGPLAATFLDNWYIVLFLNQLTVTTAVIIALQSQFIRSYTGGTERKGFIWILIGIHIAMALIVAVVGFIPIESLFHSFVEGGAGNE
ncbi:hypothetical protein FQ087_13555 [Sporosarcina sp. ANT_H38]|uniref:hypothetical protein n=1 Tax=Sporosarcina sp. ANT_H38 TaxID=2597358 RepID=UPI0011F11D68|nr:hypothetical protein [Sporosarcina sp. ANT_H38]KAA0955623.1 hypothetical protein FQ087_13555 [Sporosarcina sp. ANT_H38]